MWVGLVLLVRPSHKGMHVVQYLFQKGRGAATLYATRSPSTVDRSVGKKGLK